MKKYLSRASGAEAEQGQPGQAEVGVPSTPFMTPGPLQLTQKHQCHHKSLFWVIQGAPVIGGVCPTGGESSTLHCHARSLR